MDSFESMGLDDDQHRMTEGERKAAGESFRFGLLVGFSIGVITGVILRLLV